MLVLVGAHYTVVSTRAQEHSTDLLFLFLVLFATNAVFGDRTAF